MTFHFLGILNSLPRSCFIKNAFLKFLKKKSKLIFETINNFN